MTESLKPSNFLDPNRPVDFTQDGLGLSPTEIARLLLQISETSGIRPGNYLEGGTVAELEDRMALRLGKEAGLYVPTGTLANYLAVLALTREGDRVVVDATSHLACDAGDGLARWAGRALVRLDDERAGFSPRALEHAFTEAQSGKVPCSIGAVALESPMRRRGGERILRQRLEQLSAIARTHGAPVHLDAARLFIACAWTGEDPAEVAALAETVYVSLWKCFNAPSGAVLVGPRHRIEPLRPVRRAMGGCPPDAWVNAAIALFFLQQDMAPFERARKAGDRLIEHIESTGRLRVERVIQGTNILRLNELAETRGAAVRPSATPRFVLPEGDSDGSFTLKMNPTLLNHDLPTLARGLAAYLWDRRT